MIYQPRIEVANNLECKAAWQDWGSFDKKATAVKIAKKLKEEIKAGKFDNRLSAVDKAKGFRLGACIEELTDNFELVKIVDV